jgi:hypothetical protein
LPPAAIPVGDGLLAAVRAYLGAAQKHAVAAGTSFGGLAAGDLAAMAAQLDTAASAAESGSLETGLLDALVNSVEQVWSSAVAAGQTAAAERAALASKQQQLEAELKVFLKKKHKKVIVTKLLFFVGIGGERARRVNG